MKLRFLAEAGGKQYLSRWLDLRIHTYLPIRVLSKHSSTHITYTYSFQNLNYIKM
jgi:hypothetical protein